MTMPKVTISVTEESPEFICRGCGYHVRSCVCTMQKHAVATSAKPAKVFVLESKTGCTVAHAPAMVC